MKLVDLNDGVVISYYPNRMVCSSKKVIEQLKKYIQLHILIKKIFGI